ncbi:transporter substrate-binding domain-containing protein [Psychrobium sp. MM17-31]|uniref:substrate-binding periplasmic protein n=1 Tax=Psychrobium sp. MM17-31 TaxID=2917758 RepID=UPI001EF45F6A|nr:transporter substrate-binding domain-containing protein [Psychrobium sp. MM17-31]MCG7530425.1 transporter substrate-binding domain-containing protein [Psychrobium sp. MM17-31]
MAEAQAQEKCAISAGWMERPSYQYAKRNGKPDGFDIAYMKALAKELNCSIVFKKMPWFRQDKEMVAGRLDFLLGALPSGETPELIRVSSEYRQDPIGFYVHKSDVHKIENKSITQLLDDGFMLGTIAHDTHSPEVLNLIKKPRYKARIFPVESTKALLRNFKRKMLGAIMLHAAEVDYMRQKKDPFVKDLVLIPQLSFTRPAHLILGRDSSLGADYIHTVNQGIAALNEKQIPQKLIQKYVPSHQVINIKGGE